MEILKDKKLLVGGLALVGGIALVAFLLKPTTPKRNSEGFCGANGRMSRRTGGCYICRTSPTSVSGYYAVNGNCRQGDYCSRSLKSLQANSEGFYGANGKTIKAYYKR